MKCCVSLAPDAIRLDYPKLRVRIDCFGPEADSPLGYFLVRCDTPLVLEKVSAGLKAYVEVVQVSPTVEDIERMVDVVIGRV